MARKIISYYNDAQEAAVNARLFLEIGNDQVACLIKGEGQEVGGFELFDLEKDKADWSDIFYAVQSASEILNRQYRETHCYYNCEEALIMPQQAFNATAAEDYLALVYGESERHEIKYDMLSAGAHLVNAYRVKRSVHELVGRHFVLYQPHHAYSKILDDILLRGEISDQFIKIQFYSDHIILAFMQDKQLQLVQSFRYKIHDDILYHILTIIQQFDIGARNSHLELSGAFDQGSALYRQFMKLFGRVSFETVQNDTSFLSALAAYPAHYFTPFHKLAL
jgi:hypothetical protein